MKIEFQRHVSAIYSVKEVRSGERTSLEMIDVWCGGEKLTREGDNPIGFTC